MSFLYITEFANQGTDVLGRPTPAARVPSNLTQRVAIGATSAQSSAFGDTTNLVRVHADEACSITFATNPTATTSMLRMAADSTEYFSVQAGTSLKIAVIANT
jgi:hypothetical protein